MYQQHFNQICRLKHAVFCVQKISPQSEASCFLFRCSNTTIFEEFQTDIQDERFFITRITSRLRSLEENHHNMAGKTTH